MNTPTNAIILSIGDELTLGQSVDTNAAWLSHRLVHLGIFPTRHITVPDGHKALVDVFHEITHTAKLVIVTGGLGPTEDDMTRFALAEVMGAELIAHQDSLEQIKAFFAQRDRPMPKTNEVQALCPFGAAMLENPSGTAPGIKAPVHRSTVYCLPGVPREMKVMFDKHIEPELVGLSGQTILTRMIHTYGQGESTVAQMLGELMNRDKNPTVGTTAKNSVISVRIRAVADEHQQAEQLLDEVADKVIATLDTLVFGQEEITFAEAIGQLLIDREQTLATAESCTGGMVGKLFTDAPGASQFFRGGWVTYCNEMKSSQLDVPTQLLDAHGAVSSTVASAMAEGALKNSEADHAIAITGIAGPDGGTEEKPVGTVWLAIASKGDKTHAQKHLFPFERETVRIRSALEAMQLVRLRLLGEL